MCHAKRQKECYAKRKKEVYETIKERRSKMGKIVNEKKSVPCMDCGKEYPAYVMDFDHVRGQKLFGIAARGRYYSEEILLQEIAKCDVVCSNCHRIRTAKRTPLRCGIISNPPVSETGVV